MQLCHCYHYSNPLLLQSFYCIFVCTNNLLLARLIFSLSLCQTQYYVVHVFSPCHLAYLYRVFDCSCIVYSSIQPPTKCLSPQFFLCRCVLTFLHLVVASLFFFHPPPPMPYSLYIDRDSAYCIFCPLWHCHSCLCLCCRYVVTIELLLLWDSLIVRMGGLVVKSIQSSE